LNKECLKGLWRKKMSKHADKRRDVSCGGASVLEGPHEDNREMVLSSYDATAFVGLRTIVYDAAIKRVDEDGEVTIELPKQGELVAAAAVSRCLMPIKLRGYEIRAMRHIMKMTLADLAKRLDEKTAPETISRWESEAQPMGGYAERCLRLIVCEELASEAPGIEYKASILAKLRISDPWVRDKNYEPMPVELELVMLKEQGSGSINEAWNEKKAA